MLLWGEESRREPGACLILPTSEMGEVGVWNKEIDWLHRKEASPTHSLDIDPFIFICQVGDLHQRVHVVE
jgi:hypothetical protein